VAALQDTCLRTGVPPPVIVSESGRAIASSSAALVFEVISTEPRGARGGASLPPVEEGLESGLGLGGLTTKSADETEESISSAFAKTTIDELRVMAPSSFLLHNFRAVLRDMTMANSDGNPATNIQESLNDAAQFRREADRLFKLGIMGLEGRAEAEELFASVRGFAFELARLVPEGEVPPMEVGMSPYSDCLLVCL
jgi:arginine decarboxylase-like protein